MHYNYTDCMFPKNLVHKSELAQTNCYSSHHSKHNINQHTIGISYQNGAYIATNHSRSRRNKFPYTSPHFYRPISPFMLSSQMPRSTTILSTRNVQKQSMNSYNSRTFAALCLRFCIHIILILLGRSVGSRLCEYLLLIIIRAIGYYIVIGCIQHSK